MPFNKFSASQDAQSNDKPEDKAKAAPAGGQPAAQPARKQDEGAPQDEAAPAHAPAQKS